MKEDNQAVIKALNMYGRVPEMWELLEEIERLNNIINELEKYIKEQCWKDEWGVDTIYTNSLLEKLQELKGSDKE